LRLSERYFLYVGRLISSKGVFDLLDAYGRIPADLRAKVALLFVGNGKERSKLEERAAAAQPGSVRFLGFAQREQLAIYYALAEALVFPTHTDPWGLVVNEAMACGLPIIATDVAGCTPDLVRDGANGYVVPSKDVDKLMVALVAFALDPQLRPQMAECSVRLIQSYSPELCAAGLALTVGFADRVSRK